MRRITVLVLAIGVLLAPAADAVASSPAGTYRGRTSQRLSVTVVVSSPGGFGPTVTSIAYRANFKCRTGTSHKNVGDSWQPFAQISGGSFNYSWDGTSKTSFSLTGRIHGRVATGSFTDRFLIGCSTGKVTFTASTA